MPCLFERVQGGRFNEFVFQGNQVQDESWEIAMFQELSSCPATMEASKAADIFGMLEGHKTMQSDAAQAYTQSKLGGHPYMGAFTI